MSETATHFLTVEGKTYPAFIDGSGEIRFVSNPILRDLIRETEKAYVQKVIIEEVEYSAYNKTSLRKIHEGFHHGGYTFNDLLEFYISIGYSVKYLKMLPEFENLVFTTTVISE